MISSLYLTVIALLVGCGISIYGITISLRYYFMIKYKPYLLLGCTFLALFNWNLINLLLALLPADGDPETIVRVSSIFSMHILILLPLSINMVRTNKIPFSVYLMTIYVSIISSTMYYRRDLFFAVYSSSGWSITFSKLQGTLGFLFIWILSIILIPMYRDSKYNEFLQENIKYLNISGFLSLVSLTLGMINLEYDTNFLRYLTSDILFLILLMVILKAPYSGIADDSTLNRLIVLEENGLKKPIFYHDRENSISIQSNVFIGIDRVIREVSGEDKIDRIIVKDRSYLINRINSYFLIMEINNPQPISENKMQILSNQLQTMINTNKFDSKSFMQSISLLFPDFI